MNTILLYTYLSETLQNISVVSVILCAVFLLRFAFLTIEMYVPFDRAKINLIVAIVAGFIAAILPGKTFFTALIVGKSATVVTGELKNNETFNKFIQVINKELDERLKK